MVEFAEFFSLPNVIENKDADMHKKLSFENHFYRPGSSGLGKKALPYLSTFFLIYYMLKVGRKLIFGIHYSSCL